MSDEDIDDTDENGNFQSGSISESSETSDSADSEEEQAKNSKNTSVSISLDKPGTSKFDLQFLFSAAT